MDTSWIAWAVAMVAILLWLHERRLRHQSGAEQSDPYGSDRVGRPLPAKDGLSPDQNAAREPQSIAIEESSDEADPRWVPATQGVTVAGHEIGGMVYVGHASRARPLEKQIGAAIDPSQPVSAGGDDLAGTGMGYWPTYASIQPGSRTTYLEWLASGRSDPAYSVGYVFLYFYGLEYRFFDEQPGKEEREAIVAEVERLLDIYGENRSVRDYLGRFLEVSALYSESGPAMEPIFQRVGQELPLRVRCVIGRKIQAGETVSADWMLSWMMTHPDAVVRMPARRAFPEFQALFRVRFAEKYPKGLKVAIPRRKLSVHYPAASGTFAVDLSEFVVGVPDISALSRPTRLATEIANAACAELSKFSRYLLKNPGGRDTIAGHSLLPAAIRPLFSCSELESLRSWAAARRKAGGLVPLSCLLGELEGARPDRATKRQLVRAANALALLSIGMSPDPRFSFRGPKLNDPVILFPLPEGASILEAVGDGYRRALLSITIGAFVAHSDGEVSGSERQYLKSLVDRASGLTAAEANRLRADVDWLTAVPPDLRPFRKRLREVDGQARHEISRLALAVAGADGRLEPREIDAIRVLYRALGLDAEEIYKDLHALSTTERASEPVTVRQPASSESGYGIPPPPEQRRPDPIAAGLELDLDRVSEIMADTARVSAVLRDVFIDDEDKPERVSHEPTHRDESPRLAGLGAEYGDFLQELILRSTWPASEFEALARKYGLMPGGALEAVNEWAYERFEEPLIEEDEEFQINVGLVAGL